MPDAAETRTSAQIVATTGPVLPARLSADEGRFVPGTLIAGRYRIISLLGRGGMGEVYRATDLTLGQPVALKFLPDTGVGFERMLERFQNEVRVARQVSHPNVCRVYDLGEFENMPYMSMEYIDGEDLSGLLSKIGRLPADKALDIARKICAGLAAAHNKGVIHRDLKPANIMLDKRGNAIIMDFGLAAVTDELRGAEARSGSPAYQAPEQLRGEEVTAKSDIYALGLVLYELFTGKRAYEAAKSIPDLIRMQEEARFASMNSIASDVDPAVEKAIRKCLDPLPANRPPSALSVSGSLPGGDPLAAALAAGETPSPELVAAAGRTQGLALKYSAPIALAMIAFSIATPFMRRDHEIHSLTPMDLAPEVLAAKVRDMASEFGYPQQPADRVFKLETNSWLYGAAAKSAQGSARGLEELRRWYAAESPAQLTYRESPQQLNTLDGAVTFEEPAPVISGMIEASITTSGELRRFAAVPPQLGGGVSSTPFDAALIARTTGIDVMRLEEVPPTFTPLYAFDWQKAWKGKHPRLDVEITVEAASWHGKLTHLLVVWPGMQGGRIAAVRQNSERSIGFRLATYGLNGLGVVIAAFLAIRNLRAGRGDIRGALRLTGLLFVLRAIVWLGRSHWTADLGMVSTVVNSLGDELLAAAIWWLMYIALEPSVRSRWPGVLVSWNRILIGRWSDPLVATRVLQGGLTGMVLTGIFFLNSYVQAERGQWDRNVTFNLGMETRGFVADLASSAREAVELGFTVVFALFLLRTLLRKDWLAVVAAAGILTTLEAVQSNHFEPLQLLFFLAVFSGLAYVLLRLGLVATMAVSLFTNLLLRTPGLQDLTKWYEWTVIAYPMVAFIVILWAFWLASGEEALQSGLAAT